MEVYFKTLFRLHCAYLPLSQKGCYSGLVKTKLESSNEQDCMALYIEDGHLVYVFRLNIIEHRVLTSITINNGQQCLIILQQIGNQGSIEIPDYSYQISGHSEPIDKGAKILPGNLFLGGAPNLIEFKGGRSVDGFGGCIHIVEDQNCNTIDLGPNAVSVYVRSRYTNHPRFINQVQ